jgi:hypothetical protein
MSSPILANAYFAINFANQLGELLNTHTHITYTLRPDNFATTRA